MILNITIIILQLYIVALQLSNFFKYKETNGANRQRILMFLCALLMLAHAVHSVHNHPMWFLFGVTIIGIQLYDGYGIFLRWIIKTLDE